MSTISVPRRRAHGQDAGQADQADQRRPLLSGHRATFTHEMDGTPVFSCASNPHSHLPVYTNIHRIRRDISSIVEDYLSLDQLRDVRINVSVIRPLVDKLYELDDISIVYCLLVNRARFLDEQSHLNNRQNVSFTRAMLCELVATRILRRFNEDNEGPQGLLVLAHVLVAGFEPFQNAPEAVRRKARASADFHATLPALEVAIISECKLLLSSASCTKVIDAIYEGRIIYTPSSFLDIIPDRYKQKPISLYDPRKASLLNQYRLIVPRTRNILEIMQFVLLLLLYLGFMAKGPDPGTFSPLEACFSVYAFGWMLDQFATMLEHGWHVYTQNLWAFLDVTFACIYCIYAIMRFHGWSTGQAVYGKQALDVLAMGAPVLIPRLAFNLLSDNLLFVGLRSMMADFTLLTVLAAWCFFGFLLSLIWLGADHEFSAMTVAKWMIFIWFGLDGTGIHRSTEFHWLLGPILMITFAFLGNTLFLTILVSMLSNTFSTIVSNATAEIQFRRAVLTLEGVKSDAIFAYQPPFNILALLVLVPLKFFVSARWFHKIHVFSVRLLNLPLLLFIAGYERGLLWPSHWDPCTAKRSSSTSSLTTASAAYAGKKWWERWRITAHSDIEAVFDVPPPDEVLGEIAADDYMTAHLIRRQFAASRNVSTTPEPGAATPAATSSARSGIGMPTEGGAGQQNRCHNRRDSIAPFPGLRAELQSILGASNEGSDITARLEVLEECTGRIEELLTRLVGDGDGGAGQKRKHVDSSAGDDESAVVDQEEEARTGTLRDLDRTAEEF